MQNSRIFQLGVELITAGLAQATFRPSPEDEEAMFQRWKNAEHYEVMVQELAQWIALADRCVVDVKFGVPQGRRWRVRREFPPAFALGTWDLAFQNIIAHLLRDGDVFYDVGANAGFHALVASKLVGSSGLIVCFEPVPSNCDVITDMKELNNLLNVKVECLAVSDQDTNVRFYPGRSNGLGSIVSSVDHNTGFVEVPAITLDSYALRNPEPSLVKVDVEGAEDRVLCGARALLVKPNPPAFLIELHTPDSAKAALDALRDVGFRYWQANDDVAVNDVSPTRVIHIVAMHDKDPRWSVLFE